MRTLAASLAAIAVLAFAASSAAAPANPHVACGSQACLGGGGSSGPPCDQAHLYWTKYDSAGRWKCLHPGQGWTYMGPA